MRLKDRHRAEWDRAERERKRGRLFVCVLSGNMNTKAARAKKKEKQEKNRNRVLSSNQITPFSSAGRPPSPPSASPLPPPPGSFSLSLPLRHSRSLSACLPLSLSLHPLSERHAEAVGLLRRVWGSARAVRGCYLGLLQQTGSSSPKGRGRDESQESRSDQLNSSSARQEPELHSS